MRRNIIGQDLSGQELPGLHGYYKNCNLSNTTITGVIDAVLKDCTVDTMTFDDVDIKRLHTPGTKLPNVIINKRNFQPIHWAKCKIWKQHSHEYNAGLMRKTAETQTVVKKRLLLIAADFIEEHKEMSWKDFLYHPKVPKILWDMFEDYYRNDEEHIEFVRELKKTRWP